MTHAVSGFIPIICLAVLSAGPAFTQTIPDEAITGATTAAPVAYVYVGTNNGVNLYDADAQGRLTLVKGSPFKTIGSLWGSNGKHLITMGTYFVHSYPVAANGAIGPEDSQIDTQSYPGADCGSTDNAVLDHTGQNVYVFLNIGGDGCAAYQSYNIAKATGKLTFNDVVMHPNGGPWHINPVFTGDDKFAYVLEAWSYGEPATLSAFTRQSSGGLQALSFKETDPTPHAGWEYWASTMTPDPTNHLAMGVVPYNPTSNVGGSIQLASYTVDSHGNIASTNTWEDMPTPAVSPSNLRMSPDGKYLVVAGNQNDYAWGASPMGLQVFHFNGADPITPFTAPLTDADIDGTGWDHHHHFYSVSSGTNQIFVYTVTPASVTPVPGSPFRIPDGGPQGLVVVPM